MLRPLGALPPVVARMSPAAVSKPVAAKPTQKPPANVSARPFSWLAVISSPWLLGLLAAAILALWGPPVVTQPDAVRDWLEARDCLDHDLCATRGAPTSVVGLYDGALWLHLVAAAQSIGLTPHLLDAGVAATQGLSVALVAAAAAQMAWPVVPAALLALAGMLATTGSTRLWAPALVPWLAALLLLVLVRLQRQNGERPKAMAVVFAVLVGGGCGGLLLDAHPMGAAAVLGLAVALTAEAPWAGPPVLGLAVGVAYLLGPGAVQSSLPWLQGHAVALVGLAAAAWLVGLVAWLVLRKRPALAVVVPALPALAMAAAVLLLPLLGHDLAPRYLLAALPGLAWAVVGLGQRWLQRPVTWLVPLTVTAAAVTLVPRRLPEPLVPWTAVPKLAEIAQGRNMLWPGLLGRVQARHTGALVAALQTLAPDRPNTKPGNVSLQVLWAPERALPSPWQKLAEAPGRQLVARTREVWLRWEAGSICKLQGEAKPDCKPLRPGVQPSSDGLGAVPLHTTWGQRAYPRMTASEIQGEGQWQVFVPVMAPGSGQARTLYLLDNGKAACPWQIVGMDDELLPQPMRQWLFAPKGIQRQTWLELRKRVGGQCGPDDGHGMPPDVIELEEAETWML